MAGHRDTRRSGTSLLPLCPPFWNSQPLCPWKKANSAICQGQRPSWGPSLAVKLLDPCGPLLEGGWEEEPAAGWLRLLTAECLGPPERRDVLLGTAASQGSKHRTQAVLARSTATHGRQAAQVEWLPVHQPSALLGGEEEKGSQLLLQIPSPPPAVPSGPHCHLPVLGSPARGREQGPPGSPRGKQSRY